jgi:uncharacterized tellurite resistance protein B-like protein
LNKAAYDPAMTAEMLLLLRMILADGRIGDERTEMLRRICRDSIDLGDGAFEAVTAFADETAQGISQPQMIAVFRGFDRERRIALARRLAAIVQSDAELKRREARVMIRVLDILDLEREDLAGAAG